MRRVGYKVTSLSVALAREQTDFILQKGIHIGLSLYSIGISVLIIPVHTDRSFLRCHILLAFREIRDVRWIRREYFRNR